MESRDEQGRYTEKAKDLTGKRFFRLVVLRRVKTDDKNHAYWECKCDCGNRKVVRKDSLESGHAKSCGCYLQERYKDGHNKKYDDTDRRLYKIWQGMKQRCENPNCEAYKNYGGRGIIVCQEWKEFPQFAEWSKENGFDPNIHGHDMSIDRINVDGNYEPSNCRWVDHYTQNYNKRCTVRVDINGEKLTLRDISEKYLIPLTTVRSRYRRYVKGRILASQIVE